MYLNSVYLIKLASMRAHIKIKDGFQNFWINGSLL